jgi:hypothetical protein
MSTGLDKSVGERERNKGKWREEREMKKKRGKKGEIGEYERQANKR